MGVVDDENSGVLITAAVEELKQVGTCRKRMAPRGGPAVEQLQKYPETEEFLGLVS